MSSTRFGYNANQLMSHRPLENFEMQRIAPSIFAPSAHVSRSQKYAYIPTSVVLEGLRSEGFFPFFVAQAKSRIPGKADFTKHMIRFRREGQIGQGGAPEFVLVNSHDGTSSYILIPGWIEFLCLNGCIAGERFNEVRIQHSGNVKDRVIDAAYTVVKDFQVIADQRESMRALTLNTGEQQAYARAALELKYDEPEKAPIQAERLLAPRYREQADASLWSTFQSVQGNTLRGGQSGRAQSGRRQSTRAVTGIDQNVKLNRALWTLAEEMQKLKAAA